MLHLSSSPCPSRSLFYIAAALVHHFAPHWSWPWFADLTSDPSPCCEPVWRSVNLFDLCYHPQICFFCIQRLQEATALPASLASLHPPTCFSFWSSPLLLLLDTAWHFMVWNDFLWFRCEKIVEWVCRSSWHTLPLGAPKLFEVNISGSQLVSIGSGRWWGTWVSQWCC